MCKTAHTHPLYNNIKNEKWGTLISKQTCRSKWEDRNSTVKHFDKGLPTSEYLNNSSGLFWVI